MNHQGSAVRAFYTAFVTVLVHLNVLYGIETLAASSEHKETHPTFSIKMESWEALQDAGIMLREPSPDWKPECIATWDDGSPKTIEFIDPVSDWPLKRLEYYEGLNQVFRETDLFAPSVGVSNDEAMKGVTDGVEIYYYTHGAPCSITTYSRGKKHGMEKRFYDTGSLELSRTYVDGVIVGDEFLFWPENKGRGGIKQHQRFENGVVQGVAITYSRSGEKECEATYKDGLLHGKMVSVFHSESHAFVEESFWYLGLLTDTQGKPAISHMDMKTGKRILEAHYLMGSPHGVHTEWHHDGSIKRRCSFVRGAKEGEELIYDRSGNVIGSGTYIQGSPVGRHIRKSSIHGALVSEQIYSPDGTSIHIKYSEENPDAIVEKYTCKNGIISGTYLAFYPAPSSSQSGAQEFRRFHFTDGKLDGFQEEYYPSGQKAFSFQFKKGKREGKQIEWDSAGNTLVSAEFFNGYRTGKYQDWFFHKPSQQHLECTFKDGCFDDHMIAWHENGSKDEESYWKNGSEDGLLCCWDDNGTLLLECLYREGQLEGSFKEWYQDGCSKKTAYYSKGNLEGKVTEWHPNGEKSLEAQYLNNLLTGVREEWYDDRSLAARGSYKNGKPIGKHIRMYPNDGDIVAAHWGAIGKPVFIEEFFDNDGLYDGVQKAYYPNGKTKTIASYNHGTLHGPKERYDINGRKVFSVTYKKGVLDGAYMQIFSDGMREERMYEKGLPHGVWKTFYPQKEGEDLCIAAQASYVNGRIQGEYREFYPHGEISLTIPFQDGLRHGRAVIYTSEGHVSVSTDYVQGNQEGEMLVYYPSGLLYKKSMFHHSHRHGPEITYHENGKEKIRSNYDQGILDGSINEWSENGTLLYEGVYDKGLRNGVFRKYSEDGVVKVEMVYRNDQLIAKKNF